MPDDTPTTKPDDTSRASDSCFDKITDDITAIAPKVGIVFYDDDETPIDFVMAALKNVLGYDEPEARDIVHKLDSDGKVTVVRMQRTPAEESLKRILAMAESSGYPFKAELTD
ncbi:MAG: ATP-dependent Clp protease adaptor ClpS [Planctomycetes bacterium]|nr:ATP-dependent Clp protease adaptor ClpS [Planctomycetota bacterium]